VREPRPTTAPPSSWLGHIGPALGVCRELRGMMQAECARQAGLTKSQLCLYETGRVPPMLVSLEKALQVLKLGPAEFFAIVAAVDLFLAGEGDIEEILATIQERQRSVVEEVLAGVARVRREGPPALSSVGRKATVWSKILKTGAGDPTARP